MKSVVELEIDASQPTVAALFDDFRTFPRWMTELERVEPISGDLAHPGSKVRLVPKNGSLEFVAWVVARDPPHRSQLVLDAPRVSVAVTGRFAGIADRKTRLVSEEVFTFRGLLGGLAGLFGRSAIRSAHRRHIEAFKRFAESQDPPIRHPVNKS
jgi:Polyketide cyclase / dehydrase and lipid transport